MATTFPHTIVPPVAAVAHQDVPWREPVPFRQVVVGTLGGLGLIAASLLAWVAIVATVLRAVG